MSERTNGDLPRKVNALVGKDCMKLSEEQQAVLNAIARIDAIGHARRHRIKRETKISAERLSSVLQQLQNRGLIYFGYGWKLNPSNSVIGRKEPKL